jgi:hypothetical protein
MTRFQKYTLEEREVLWLMVFGKLMSTRGTKLNSSVSACMTPALHGWDVSEKPESAGRTQGSTLQDTHSTKDFRYRRQMAQHNWQSGLIDQKTSIQEWEQSDKEETSRMGENLSIADRRLIFRIYKYQRIKKTNNSIKSELWIYTEF